MNARLRSTIRPFRSNRLSTLALLALVVLAGCKEENIRTYTTTKRPPETIQGLMAESHASKHVGTKPETAPEMMWNAPKAWAKRSGSQPMRVATYDVQTETDSLEVVISQWPSPVGTLLDNINRWRGQIGMDNLTGDALTKLAQDKQSGFMLPLELKPDPRLQGYLFDLNTQTDPDGKRMLIGLLVDTFKRTWFIKSTSTVRALEAAKADFHGFVSSFHLKGAPPATGETTDQSQGLLPVAWTRPEGWTLQSSGSGMITAAFLAGSGEMETRTTIIALGGDGGGALPNLNRWRGQISLDPLEDIADQPQRIIKTIGGLNATVYDLGSERDATQSSILVASVSAGGRTWYIKMTGSKTAIGKQVASFDSLVGSLEFVGESK